MTGGPASVGLPVLAVVGRPNVGKSTLVNRIIGRQAAVVEDVPGVTRDRVAYDAEWSGRRFTLLDTGGWIRDGQGMAARIAESAEIAMATADAVLLVVDAKIGATVDDEAVIRVLRRSGKPVLLVANKVDDAALELESSGLWSLGLGQPWPVSALHGRGSGDLLDEVLRVLPETPEPVRDDDGPRRVALVGKPNVGKSSLLNQLAGSELALVDSVAGTTRDPVDSLVEIDGTTYHFVDTAGLRKRVKQASGAEYYSSLRTERALEAAEVALVLLDSSEPLSEQDQRIITLAADSGRAVVIALNKWDLVDGDRRILLDREIDRDLSRVTWAPRVNVSARTGRGVVRIDKHLKAALAGWDTRVSTGRLNSWIGELIAATPPPVRGGKQPKVLFATQASTRPPRFVLFTSGFLEAGYRRFIERRLREDFGFVGSPVEVSVRVREKKPRSR
jgi:GTP-binding protein